ncbi:MAG: CBS domain-containing protein [Planctomycetaceae bacterium]
MKLAADVMAGSPITMSPATPVTEAINTLLHHRISGAPVVDDDGNLVGMISEIDLLNVIVDDGMAFMPVGELMSRQVVTVDDDTPLVDVAQAFLSLRLRRLPVLRGGKMVGQISRRDLLRVIADDDADPRHHRSAQEKLRNAESVGAV